MEERICFENENGFELYLVNRPEDVLGNYYIVYYPKKDNEPFQENFKVFLHFSDAKAFYDAFKWGYEYAKAN